MNEQDFPSLKDFETGTIIIVAYAVVELPTIPDPMMPSEVGTRHKYTIIYRSQNGELVQQNDMFLAPQNVHPQLPSVWPLPVGSKWIGFVEGGRLYGSFQQHLWLAACEEPPEVVT